MKIIYGIIAMILLGNVLWWGSSFGEGKAQEISDQVPSQEEYRVSSLVLSQTYEAFGFVRGIEEVDVVPKVSGYLKELKVSEGDRVKQGQVIAIIDADEHTAGLLSAESAENLSRNSAKASDRYYDEQVSVAEKSLEKAKKIRDQAKDSEESDAYEVAKKDVLIAEHNLDSAKRFQEMNATIAEGNADVAYAREQEALVWEKARFVRAPFSGVVTKKISDRGAWVSPQNPIVSVSNDSDKEVPLFVGSDFAKNIEKGQSVTLQKESGDTFLGTVLTVAPASRTSSQKVSVAVRISEKENVSLGEWIRASFVSEVGGSKRVVIPTAYLSKEYFDTFVFVSREGNVEKRKVTIGRKTGEFVEVVSGLSEGENLVFRNN